MEKLFFKTKGAIYIKPLFSMKRGIDIFDEEGVEFPRISCSIASWRSDFLNTVKGKYPRKSEKSKLIILEDVSYQSEQDIECHFARIDFLEDWVKMGIEAIDWELKRHYMDSGDLSTILNVNDLRDKIQNNVEISLEEIQELDGYLESIKAFNERIHEMYRNYRNRKDGINLMEFMGAWELIDSFVQEGKLLFTVDKFAYIDKSIPDEIINFLQTGGYKVMRTSNIDVVTKTSEMFERGLVKFFGFIAQVHDSVDLDVIDYLKNEMHFIIETL